MLQPLRFIEACRRRYGGVVTFRTSFDANFVMVLDPEVVEESLRVRPVIPGVVRGEPYELGDYSIPSGVEINPSIAVVHRGKSFPAPLEFRPERFLDADPPDTYSWIPFGGGTRRCLGASFALFEMRVAIRTILERAVLEPVDRRPERVERRGITLVARRARDPHAEASAERAGAPDSRRR